MRDEGKIKGGMRDERNLNSRMRDKNWDGGTGMWFVSWTEKGMRRALAGS